MSIFQGRVTSADTGEGIDDVKLLIVSAPVAVPDVALLTYGGGNFALSLPGSGHYEFEFRRDGYATVRHAVDINDGDAQANIVVRPVTTGTAVNQPRSPRGDEP